MNCTSICHHAQIPSQDQKAGFHAARHDVGKSSNRDEPCHQRNHVKLGAFGSRHQPHHRGHQERGSDGAKAISHQL
jgi:hypothetical protein